jgi:proline racemase
VALARGEIGPGGKRISRSIIGGEFTAEALALTRVGNREAVLPRITGQAWIYGREQLRIDPDDPFPLGFALSDSWGPQVGELD